MLSAIGYHRFTVFFIIVLGNWTLYLTPLAHNFLHNVVVVVVIFVSKAWCIVIDVGVAVSICDF